MAPSLLWCAIDREGEVALAFLAAIGVTVLLAGLLFVVSRHAREDFQAQEGFVTVGLCWVFMSLVGCLPFYFTREIPQFVDAFFEAVSGFTTTGASIVADVEGLSRAVVYWRSFTHWLGGMGMLVFALAVVPASKTGSGRLYLMRAESPGPSVGKFTPRLRQTAVILYGIYMLLTVVCVAFLLAGGMPLFDSLCTAFGTAGTGGFGIKNDSMAGYSPYLQNVCTVFMLLFGVNFNIYFFLLMRQFMSVFRDEELRTYLLIFLSGAGLIAWNIRPLMESWGQSIHHAAFQVSSIMTTTGFSTVDFDVWPPFSKAILLCLMVLGACAGSTGGGIKTIRFILLIKDLRCNIRRTLHPRSLQLVHINGQTVDSRVLWGVSAYMAAYWLLLGASVVLVSLDGFMLESNISAVFSCFNNIGPGFGVVGPMSNYGSLGVLSKLVLSADMLLGRLELFPLLALFSRHSWNRRL